MASRNRAGRSAEVHERPRSARGGADADDRKCACRLRGSRARLRFVAGIAREARVGSCDGMKGSIVPVMKKRDKAVRIGEILDRLYPSRQSRLDKNPFTLLVAVVLSAQTTDVQVNKVTPARSRARKRRRNCCDERERHPVHHPNCGLGRGKRATSATRADGSPASTADAFPKRHQRWRSSPASTQNREVVVSRHSHAHFAVDTHIHRLACDGDFAGKMSNRTDARSEESCSAREEWAKPICRSSTSAANTARRASRFR